MSIIAWIKKQLLHSQAHLVSRNVIYVVISFSIYCLSKSWMNQMEYITYGTDFKIRSSWISLGRGWGEISWYPAASYAFLKLCKLVIQNYYYFWKPRILFRCKHTSIIIFAGIPAICLMNYDLYGFWGRVYHKCSS